MTIVDFKTMWIDCVLLERRLKVYSLTDPIAHDYR